MNKKKDGLHTEWYENDKKKSEGTFKDGKPTGLFTNWYENGQKKVEVIFKEGKLVSEKKWHKDGSSSD